MVRKFSVTCFVLFVTATLSPVQDTAVRRNTIWTTPEVGALPDDEQGRLVRRGRNLITATYAHIGPEVPDIANRYAGNNLACGNCHLQAGTKKFGLPIFGLFGEFPSYSARSGAEISIEERVNSCMTRSMNGRAMPAQAPQMRAIVAYLKFLSTGVPAGEKLPGLGAGHMPELARPASPANGGPTFKRACAGCHGTEGLGERRSIPTVDMGYIMPPVSGPDSFNDGAGMARLITAANFIHFNMPHGTYYLDPQLTVEEAWDVAAYLISLPRPHKQRLDRDRTFSRSRSTPPTVRMLTASVRNSICTAPSYLFAKRSRVSRQKGDCSAIGSVSPSKSRHQAMRTGRLLGQ